jgi:GNAT superfamily N-acetyltransferase
MRPSERVEVESLRSLFSVPSPAGALRQAGDAVAVRVDGVPGKVLNRIVGLYELTHLDELVSLYENRPFWISVAPESGLEDNLVARGFVRDDGWQKFERGVSLIETRTDLDVAEARASADFGAVVRETWGAPDDVAAWLCSLVDQSDWHCFVAYEGVQPVASAMLYASGDVGWLGVASTLVAYRGRGAQSALLAARIDRARRLGLNLLVTETRAAEGADPDPSYRNILRAGFAPTYVRPNYALPMF